MSVNLLGRERMESILKSALAASEADETQVTLAVGSHALTRFAGSAIHQNVSELNADLSVKAVIGKKIGFVSTNSIEPDSVLAAVRRAVEFARHQQENPDFVSLPKPRPARTDVATFDEPTAACGPEERAAAVRDVIAAADSNGASAAGSYSTGYVEYAVMNSLGLTQYMSLTNAHLSTVMTAGSGFGYAARVGVKTAAIDSAEAGREAACRAAASRDPVALEPGKYDVVLLPYAAEELVGFLCWLGLNALAVQEERSFMTGRFGERVCGENITIWDDAYDPRGLPRPFDPEGVPKERVDMIVNGVARAVVYDSYTAYREGKESTGHATGGVGTSGPMPGNVFLAPGEHSVEDMIASTDRGLLVTRFHYTNVLQPVQTVITGMTRDGTFLIEGGRVTKPVKNLRFTESVLSALSNVEMLGRDLMCLGTVTCPAMKVKQFSFTGGTEF